MDLVAFQQMQPESSVEVELGSALPSDGTPTINFCWPYSYRWYLLASYRWHLSWHVTVIN